MTDNSTSYTFCNKTYMCSSNTTAQKWGLLCEVIKAHMSQLNNMKKMLQSYHQQLILRTSRRCQYCDRSSLYAQRRKTHLTVSNIILYCNFCKWNWSKHVWCNRCIMTIKNILFLVYDAISLADGQQLERDCKVKSDYEAPFEVGQKPLKLWLYY